MTNLSRQQIVLVLLAALMLFVLFLKGRHRGNDPAVAAFVVDRPATAKIQISGTVKHAGMYEIFDNKLTIAAINLAKPDCSEKLSQTLEAHPLKIENGDHLIINCSAVSAAGGITIQPMTAATALVVGVPFSVNRVTAAELDQLPGIGPVLAQRIIEYRQKYGAFSCLDDLLKIEGIGEKKLHELKKYLKL